MKLTGAEILCESLTRSACARSSAIQVGAILPVYDALGKSKLHHVLVRHEQGATHMADGYARASVASASPWPHLVRAQRTWLLASHRHAGLFSGRVYYRPVSSKVLGSDAFQEIDITGITMPITKHNVVVTKSGDVARTIREAFLIANSGRPALFLVDITKDAQQASAEFNWEASAPKLPPKRRRNNHDQAEFDRAGRDVKHRQAPHHSRGHGIMVSGAMRAFEQFVRAAIFPSP